MTSACLQKVAANSGSNCGACPLLCQRDCGGGAPDTVSHLGELSDLGQSRRDWDGVTTKLPGPAFAVPLLVRGTDRLLHHLRQPEVLGEPASQGRVLGDHAAHVSVT